MPTATNYGTAQNKTAATTVVVTTTAIIPAGTLLVIGVCADNVAAATPTISSITAVGGGTWTDRAGATTQSGATTTAGSGVFVYCQTLYAASQVASGTAITVTFNASPAAKAVALWGFDQMGQHVLRNTVVSAVSTTGSPSAVTAGTALVASDLVIGVVGTENNVIATGDADTLNGSWSAITGIATTGGGAATNTSIAMQYKVVTAPGAQTFNPTGGVADTVAIVFAMAQQASATATASLAIAASSAAAAPVSSTASLSIDSFLFPMPWTEDFSGGDWSKWTTEVAGGLTTDAFQVSGGAGVLSGGTFNNQGRAYPARAVPAAAQGVLLTLNALTAGDSSSHQLSVILRGSGWAGSSAGATFIQPNPGYRFRFVVGAVALSATADAGGIETDLSNHLTAGTYLTPTQSTPFKTRIEIVGSVIRYRMWLVGASEPTTWTTTDPDSSVASGVMGLNCWYNSASTQWSVDDITWYVPSTGPSAAASLTITAAASALARGPGPRNIHFSNAALQSSFNR